MIRVGIADDQQLIRMGLRVLVESEGDLMLAWEAEDGRAAVAAAQAVPTDVILMDIRMPGMDGIEALRQILADPLTGGSGAAGAADVSAAGGGPQLSGRQDRTARPAWGQQPPADQQPAPEVSRRGPDRAQTRVVVLTTFESDEYVFDALQAGAAGFLVKDSEPAELLRAIRLAAAGESLLSPSVTRRVIESVRTRRAPRRPPAQLDALTDREREVLALIGEGLNNEEIAGRLVVSPATARTHVSRTMLKLGARDRAQLVVVAFQTGLVR